MKETHRVHPALARYWLRGRIADKPAATTGRLYECLKRQAVPNGGWADYYEARQFFTEHLGSKRYFMALLARGEGLLWERDDHGRIWVYGYVDVAQRLEIDAFVGRPVEVPLPHLAGDLPDFRAAMLTVVLCGRRSADNPITRQTIKDITTVSRPTQRKYAKATGVATERNFAIGYELTEYNLNRALFYERRPAFPFTDHQGRIGEAGLSYVAWPMPNTYQCPEAFTVVECSRTRTLNRRLNNVRQQSGSRKATGGNDDEDDETTRLFFDECDAAGHSWEACGQRQDRYFSSSQPGLWNVFTRQDQSHGERLLPTLYQA